MSKAPVALLIMDGFGINPSDYGNAIKAAKTPNLDRYFAECPNNIIGASGLDDTKDVHQIETNDRTPSSVHPVSTSVCRTGRWATPRSVTPISAQDASCTSSL